MVLLLTLTLLWQSRLTQTTNAWGKISGLHNVLKGERNCLATLVEEMCACILTLLLFICIDIAVKRDTEDKDMCTWILILLLFSFINIVVTETKTTKICVHGY